MATPRTASSTAAPRPSPRDALGVPVAVPDRDLRGHPRHARAALPVRAAPAPLPRRVLHRLLLVHAGPELRARPGDQGDHRGARPDEAASSPGTSCRAGPCSCSSPSSGSRTTSTSTGSIALSTRSRWLWRVHEAHHSGKDVDWLSGSRSHALEILINQTIEYAPIVLLGAHPDVALMKGVLDAAWGMYIHSNIDVRAGWLQYVLNGPRDAPLAPRGRARSAQRQFRHEDRGLGLALSDRPGCPQHKPRAYGLWDHAPFPERSGWRGARVATTSRRAPGRAARFEVDAKASRRSSPRPVRRPAVR